MTMEPGGKPSWIRSQPEKAQGPNLERFVLWMLPWLVCMGIYWWTAKVDFLVLACTCLILWRIALLDRRTPSITLEEKVRIQQRLQGITPAKNENSAHADRRIGP